MSGLRCQRGIARRLAHRRIKKNPALKPDSSSSMGVGLAPGTGSRSHARDLTFPIRRTAPRNRTVLLRVHAAAAEQRAEREEEKSDEGKPECFHVCRVNR